MSDKEIISIWKEELIKFEPEIFERNPLIDAFEEMKFDTDTSQPQGKTPKFDQKKSLFEVIYRLEGLRRGSRKWVTDDCFNKLSEIFIKYPQHYSIITKVCKLSQSTYYRILKEYSTNLLTHRTQKRTERSLKRLSKIEKASVKFMLAPPTRPITLSSI